MRKEPAFQPPARDETFTPATGPPVPPGGQSDIEPPRSRELSRDRLPDVADSPPPRGAPLTTTPTPALWTRVEAFSERIGDDSPCAGWPDYRWPGGGGGGTDPLPLPPGAASLQRSANSSPARNPPQPSQASLSEKSTRIDRSTRRTMSRLSGRTHRIVNWALPQCDPVLA